MKINSQSYMALGVLGLCFVFALVGRGIIECFSVFLLPISGSFGWDRAQVVSIYSLATLMGGVTAPFIGRLFDRYGPRTVYGLGLSLMTGAFSAGAFAQQLWQLQCCIGIGVGLGGACLGNVPSALLLGRWFGRRLATAMAVLYSAAGAGTVSVLPLSQVLIDLEGWRGTYRIFGVGFFVLAVLLLFLPWRTIQSGSPDVAQPNSSEIDEGGWTLRSAVRTFAFWGLLSTFFFTGLGVFTITVQIVAYLVDIGFSPLQAATAWGFSGVLLVVGMLTVSWLDRIIGRRRSVLLSYALTCSGIGLLWLLRYYPQSWLLAAFVVCFGGTIGTRGPLVSATALRVFRGRNVGTILGMITIGSGLGPSLGSWVGALLHDKTGGYDATLAFAFVCLICGMMPFLTMPSLQREDGR